MVITKYHPISGGSERQARKLSNALTKRGLDIFILTGAHRKLPKGWDNIDGIKVFRHFSRGIPLHGRDIAYLIGYIFGLAHALYKLRLSFDIIHVHQMLVGAWVSSLMGFLLGKPVIVKVGNTEDRFDLKQLKSTFPFISKMMVSGLTKRVTCAIAICSKNIRELLVSGFTKEQVMLIPNGVELPSAKTIHSKEVVRIQLGIQPGVTVLLFLGRLVKQKNCSTLLKTIHYLEQRTSLNFLLLIVGSGPLELKLKRKSRILGINHLVNFVGDVVDTEPYLTASDIFILPSSSEGVSNSLLEAMAHGMPGIATSVGGTTDIIRNGHNGLLVPPRNHVALANKINLLCKCPTYRRWLGLAAHETILRNYLIDTIAERYISIYRRVTMTGR